MAVFLCDIYLYLDMGKRFEILKGLPPTGPLYTTISDDSHFISDYTEGFVIRFYKTNKVDWIANFKTGRSALNAVFELAGSNNLAIIAGGICYIMNPDYEKPITFFGDDYAEAVINKEGKIIMHNNCELSVINPDGSYWHTNRISYDGIKNFRLKNNIIDGLAFEPTSGEGLWIPFTFDLETREYTGGIHRNKQKSWWQIWNK